MAQTITYENTDIDIRQWLNDIVLREYNENRRFDIDISNNDIEGDIVFNGRSQLNCSNNRIRSLVCPYVPRLLCNNNDLNLLRCPLVNYLNCAFNRELTEVVCHDNTDVICDNTCNVIRDDRRVVELPLPRITYGNHDCDLCFTDSNRSVRCNRCNRTHCYSCFIISYNYNNRIVNCPFCRSEINFNIDAVDLNAYVRRLMYAL